MRIAVVGAGAMGSVFGAKLALAGHEVTLVDIREDHLARVRERGLELRDPDGTSQRVAMAATTDPAAVPEVDVQLYLCKGFATRDAATGVRDRLATDGWAISVQNGLGNDRVLGEVFGPDRAVPGTTTVGAMQTEPGTTVMSPGTARGESETHLGPPRGHREIPAGLAAVAEAFTTAGLPTLALPDADMVIWTKLAMATTMAPLSAVLRRSVKDVVDDPHSHGLWQAMFDEVLAVAAADGVSLDRAALLAHCEQTYDAVGHHVTSMAADVVAGRRTEVETVVLEVARRGRELGVDTPVIATVGTLVRSLESSYERAL